MESNLAAKVVRVQLDEPLEPVSVEARYRQVLLIVQVGEQVVGQVWIAARRVVSPALQWQAIAQQLGPVIWRARVREALGRPGTDPGGRAEPRISVIVCTRNRTEQLVSCLESIAALQTEPEEVLVVDNAPVDDATRKLCEALPVRYVREPIPGQARARNRGLAECHGEVVAFTDDDCTVEPRWLDGLAEELADPLVMAVTGYIGPLELETPAQLWFEEHGGFERYPERRVLDPVEISPLRATAVAGAGANMIFRRSAFDHVGGFAEDLGPGTQARSGDDKYAFYRLLAAGYRIVHDPSRLVWHRHRSELPALRQVMNDYGVSEFAYTTRCLLEARDPDALVLWRWWLQHYRDDVKRYLRRSPGWVPLWLTRAEVRGAASGPWKMLRSARARRGIPPITPPLTNLASGILREQPRVEAEAPRLTVAVASRQRRDSLRRVLEALARQDYPRDRFEAVVVLDGSTDGSAEMARSLELPYPLRVVTQPQSGLAATRNRGAREAGEDDVVVFLDDDIDPQPGFLAAHAEAHREASEEIVALGYYPPARIPDPSLWALRIRAWWEDHFRRKAEPGHQWTYVDLVDGNSSMRRATLLDAGGYDERFRGGRRQDWELGIRLLERGTRFEYHPNALGVHRLDPRLASAFDHAREEGRWDVLLAQEHPQAKGHLPMGRLAGSFERRPRRSSALYHPLTRRLPLREVGVPTLQALEATGQRGRWRTLVDELLIRAYSFGVLDAIPDTTRLRDYLDPEEIRESTAHLSVDLERREALVVPPGAGAVELTIRSAGAPVATIRGTDPAGQWDPRELTERAVDFAAEPARLRLGIEGLGKRSERAD